MKEEGGSCDLDVHQRIEDNVKMYEIGNGNGLWVWNGWFGDR